MKKILARWGILMVFIALMASPVHAFYLSCKTNSMYPAIDCSSGKDIGSITENPFLSKKFMLQRYYNSSPVMGDIIVYILTPEQRRALHTSYDVFVHRVVSVTGTGYITKGDNNSFIDPWIVNKKDVAWRLVVR